MAPASRVAERRKLKEAVLRENDAHVGRDRLEQQSGDRVLFEGAPRPPRGRSRERPPCRPPAPRSLPGCPGSPASPGPSRRRQAGRRSGRGSAPANLTTTSRPVTARARRTAPIAASVPELVSRSISTDGMRSTTVLRQLDLGRGRRPVAGAARRGLVDGRDHIGVGVAEDKRAPGADPVDVAVAVGVDQLAALAAIDEDRLAAELPHRPHGRVDPARHDPQRPTVQLRRPIVTTNVQRPTARSRR